MLERQEIERIAHKVIDLCQADEVQVLIYGGESYLTRYAENHIHQNTGVSNLLISVNAIIGKRMGEASTNRLDDESLRKVAQNAAELARLSPEDPNLLPLLGPQRYEEVEAFYEEEITPMDRAEGVKRVIDMCKERGLTAAGIFSNSRGFTAVINSKGLFAFHKSTSVTFSLSVMAEGDGAGWCERRSRTIKDIVPEEIGEIAIRKAEMSRSPREIPPGRYTVILEPAATSSLVAFLSFSFNALAVDEGRSPLKGKIGLKLFGENINLASDVYHPLHRGTPFDPEGVPTRRVQLVEKGVAANLVYDRLTARKHDVQPTGHGLGLRNTQGAYPRALVMEGGESSLEEMIKTTDRGILVTRFHYENMVDPMNLILTGMTRDGTFWIEEGEMKFPIKNLRFNVSLFDILSSVEAMSEPVYAGGVVVPAMKVSDFNFSSGTQF
ncbi:TPA: TldD/PmbA family protein [Candidatus Poribacteria bacterium]|nr:TldD/PmbA family protein [Candidatus Poribacteria bacterium]